jgi:hypothetical protein
VDISSPAGGTAPWCINLGGVTMELGDVAP